MPTGQRMAVVQRRERDSRFAIAPQLPGGRGRNRRPIRHTFYVLRNVPSPSPLRSWHLYLASLASVCLCIVLWVRAKTIGEDERGNAERRALFVGLWPPMFWLIGDAVRREEIRRAGRWRRLPF